MNQGDTYSRLLDFLKRLTEVKIHFTLAYIREESVLVAIAVPGERWEVEFLRDGTVVVESFRNDGTIMHEEGIDELLRRFSD